MVVDYSYRYVSLPGSTAWPLGVLHSINRLFSLNQLTEMHAGTGIPAAHSYALRIHPCANERKKRCAPCRSDQARSRETAGSSSRILARLLGRCPGDLCRVGRQIPIQMHCSQLLADGAQVPYSQCAMAFADRQLRPVRAERKAGAVPSVGRFQMRQELPCRSTEQAHPSEG